MIEIANSIKLPKPKTMVIFTLGMILAATLCYQFIDRPVAEWTFYNTRESSWHFIWLNATYLAPLYYTLGPLFIIYLSSRLAAGKQILPWHKIALLMIFSMCLTILLNENLRVVFGRHWPATYFHGNLSWIHNKAYGFTWFKMQHEYKSFPSGHTSLMFGLMSVLYWAMPSMKVRIFALANCFAVALGLILMCYHFVSDVIIASLVGTLIAYIVLTGLQLYCTELRDSNGKT